MYQSELKTWIEELKMLKLREGYLNAMIDQAVRMLGVIAQVEPDGPPPPALDPVVEEPVDTLLPAGRQAIPCIVLSGSPAALVIEVLDRHPEGLSTSAIRVETGLPDGSLGFALTRLTGNRVVNRVRRGFYRRSTGDVFKRELRKKKP